MREEEKKNKYLHPEKKRAILSLDRSYSQLKEGETRQTAIRVFKTAARISNFPQLPPCWRAIHRRISMPIVTGHYTLNLTELPVKAPDLRIRFALQLVSHKNTLLVLYPNAEPGFEPSYARYVTMMEFRHLLLRGREILVAQGRGQLVITGQRLIGMITDGFAGEVALSESAGSVFAFALDLDDIRPAQIKEKNRRGEPIEAIMESKVGQSSVFGIKVFDHDDFLLLKDDGQVRRASLSAFLDQLTPESRRNLQVAPTVSEGEQISAHDPTVLNELAIGALYRYRNNGQQVADLNLAVQYWLEALRLPSSDPSDQPAWLNNLAIGLQDRYKLTGDLSDLDAAIAHFQQAVETTPSNSPDWLMYLSNLGSGLANRYTRTGNPADLETAIAHFQQAVQTTPSNSPDRPMYFNNLGAVLQDRYIRTGNLADLDAAISASRQAVEATPSDSPDWPGRLNNLGNSLSDRYTRTGNLADLETAIAHFQQAVQTTPSDSLDWPMYLGNLGNGLRDRYMRTRNLADLNTAISVFQQAVKATPSDSPDWPGRLSNLAAGQANRYLHTGNLADLDAAISHFQQAVQATPSDSPDRTARLYNLGNGLLDHYGRTGDPDDLDAAISHLQQAVQATLSNSPDHPMHLDGLGKGLRDRYIRTRDLTDLDAAISHFQQAVETTLSDSPEKSVYLNDLGNGLRDRYTRTGDLANLDAAIAAWEKSWSMSRSRFAALPVAYQLGQQRWGVGVVADLVTAYLEQARQRPPHTPGAYHRALEVVEGSKSRLLTQLVGRGPLPLPLGLSRKVAMREQQLLAELTALDTQELTIHDHSVSIQGEVSHLQRFQQRQAALHELEDLWTRIAHTGPEGTEYVAMRRSATLTWQEFTRLAEDLGPTTGLLSFFTTADQALFFLLRAGWDAPRVVEARLNKADLDNILNSFARGIANGTPREETWHQKLLPWLHEIWPHMEGVERLLLSNADFGHVLPWAVLIERAGWQTPSGQPMTLITLPALSILPGLRRRPHIHIRSALVCGNPRGEYAKDPDFSNLPHAETEAINIAKRFRIQPLLTGTATKAAVEKSLSSASLIHLATHAAFDHKDPLEAHIVLADGKLTAREILSHRLQADLVVISACESGLVGSLGGEELAGLSQAFLQAGARSLLLSLWKVNDPATTAFMEAFYTAWRPGADKALALRQAMTQVRQEHPEWNHAYYWGAFILVGDWD